MILVNLVFIWFGGLNIFNGSTGFSAGGVILFILTPSVVFHVLGGILPGRIRLYCHQCDHAEYFKFLKFEEEKPIS